MTAIDHGTTWPEVAQQLIKAIPTWIAAIGSVVAAYYASHAVRQGKSLHKEINGRMSELVAESKRSARAEGMAQGSREGRAESIVEGDARDVKANTAEKRLEEIRGQNQ